jgi:hypothetical protein
VQLLYLIVSVLVCATTAGLPYIFWVFYKEKTEIKYKYEIRSLYISQKSVDIARLNIAHE